MLFWDYVGLTGSGWLLLQPLVAGLQKQARRISFLKLVTL